MKEKEKSPKTISANPANSALILNPLAMLLPLSQGHLNLLSDCSRQFQYTFLEQLSSPNPPEQQERQSQGAQFHLLLQQWQFGLPIEPLMQDDRQLQQWFSAFEAAAPEILAIAPPTDAVRQPECDRTLAWQGYLLSARYDLLISTAEQAKILDWKTYPRPQTSRWLAQNWQTRLYPFILVETSLYTPEQVSMMYWFFQAIAPSPNGTDQPSQSLCFPYTRTKHEQTRQDLTTLLTQLTQWLAHYQMGESLPQQGIANGHCATCRFFTRCFGDRAQNYGSDPSQINRSESFSLTDLATIQEIPL